MLGSEIMNDLRDSKSKYVAVFLAITILTIILFSIGVFVLIGEPFKFVFILRYSIVGIILGVVFVTMLYLKKRIAYILFIIGYFISFSIMFHSFTIKNDGWAGIMGVLSWLIFMGGSIALGVVSELVFLLYKRLKAQ